MQSKAVAEGQSNKDVTDRNILKLKQLVNKTIDEQLDILNRAARYRSIFGQKPHLFSHPLYFQELEIATICTFFAPQLFDEK